MPALLPIIQRAEEKRLNRGNQVDWRKGLVDHRRVEFVIVAPHRWMSGHEQDRNGDLELSELPH